MSIKLIATDLDGTMLATDNSIPQTNLKAIESIKVMLSRKISVSNVTLNMVFLEMVHKLST